ncbi:phosphate ABC transporter substrate-binding protein PstS [Variovorax sp. KK3]|uniref:phosphate ABC transporter substrate-binding protein PstS n=1 Tax=Variovorax sp. KK3 TaxID=1855728 RepID=UPI00097CA322|nr:phosphate ABC transporter substrate-binding protein PstS [Variovorax sp. KK3]
MKQHPEGRTYWRRRQLMQHAMSAAALAVAGPGATALAQADEYGDAALRGAGSTLVQPLVEAWMRRFRSDPFGVDVANGGLADALSTDRLDYEAVGSLAGIERIRAAQVDFAATEMPLAEATLRAGGLAQFPWAYGGVAVAHHLPGITTLRLDARALAGIYLGHITRWSDPAIAAQNPDLRLPDQPIVVIHRLDGSGTSFTFTRFLSLSHPEWMARVGADLLPRWPTGRGFRGTSQVIAAVKSTPFSVSYVNAIQARQTGLAMASLRNAGGRYQPPDANAVLAAVKAKGASTGALDSLPIDASGDDSYPLVATVFGIVRSPARSARQRRAAEFVVWTLNRGGPVARQLGYLDLPESMARAVADQLISRG